VTRVDGVRARKKQRTHERLAFAAVELFAERGPRGVRVEHICERVGVGRATFFRYFDSKESAFVHGVHRGRLDALLRALAERPPEEPPLLAVRNAMQHGFADWREHREALVLEARIRTEHPSVQAWAAAQHDAWQRSLAEAIASRLEAAPADARPQLVAGIALTALRVAADRWIADPDGPTPDVVLGQTFDTLTTIVAEDAVPKRGVTSASR
jgi:AcrR family transcriptional regulator